MSFDIDLDMADRNAALTTLQKYTPAIIRKDDNSVIRHNSGVYVTDIPTNPITHNAAIDYVEAERLGYFKLDFLNMSTYSLFKNPAHLEKVLKDEIPWDMLKDTETCQQLIHIGNHMDLLSKMPEPIDSIEKLAMFLCLIRPGKRHLVGKLWNEVSKTVWQPEVDGSYSFKKSHAISLALLCSLQMRLINEGE